MRTTLIVSTNANRAQGVSHSLNTDGQVIVILDEEGNKIIHLGEGVDPEVLRKVIEKDNESSVGLNETLKTFGLNAQSLIDLILKKRDKDKAAATVVTVE